MADTQLEPHVSLAQFVREVVERTGRSKAAIYTDVAPGGFAASIISAKIGGRYYVRANAVDRYFKIASAAAAANMNRVPVTEDALGRNDPLQDLCRHADHDDGHNAVVEAIDGPIGGKQP